MRLTLLGMFKRREKQHVLKNIKDADYKSIALYGLEFIYNRNPMKHSKAWHS